jgi:hypothetical protein
VTSDKVVSNPQDYTGKPVTITGTVGQVVSQHAFTVIPSSNNRSTIQAVLTLDKDTIALAPGSPVQVEGMLQPTFDPNQAATYTGGNLGHGDFAPYNGKPYAQAEFAGPISANLTRESTSGILQSGNCAALSDALSNMQTYTGQQITVTGTVAQIIGPHAITVAPTGTNTGNNAQTLLAVAKDTGSLTTGSPVELTGTLQPAFDINQATAFAGSNIDPAALAAYNGKPYAQAMYVGPVSANLAENQNGS